MPTASQVKRGWSCFPSWTAYLTAPAEYPNACEVVTTPLELPDRGVRRGVGLALQSCGGGAGSWSLDAFVAAERVGSLVFVLTNLGACALDLRVLPRLRGRGVGSALTGAALELAAVHGWDIYAGAVINHQLAERLARLGLGELSAFAVDGRAFFGRHFVAPHRAAPSDPAAAAALLPPTGRLFLGGLDGARPGAVLDGGLQMHESRTVAEAEARLAGDGSRLGGALYEVQPVGRVRFDPTRSVDAYRYGDGVTASRAWTAPAAQVVRVLRTNLKVRDSDVNRWQKLDAALRTRLTRCAQVTDVRAA